MHQSERHYGNESLGQPVTNNFPLLVLGSGISGPKYFYFELLNSSFQIRYSLFHHPNREDNLHFKKSLFF